MRIGRIESKVVSFCLVVAMSATFSMVSLAGGPRIAGQVIVSGTSVPGETPAVLVNGEEAKSGRSIFSSSTIATNKNSSATVRLGGLGSLRIAPNSAFSLSFDENGIRGTLAKGSVMVLESSSKVAVSLPDGSVTDLTAGKTVSTSTPDDDDDNDGSLLWLWAVIIAGTVTAVIFTAARNGNRINIGGSSAIVSARL